MHHLASWSGLPRYGLNKRVLQMAKSILAASKPTPTQQSELDDALDDTFPASDPPSMTDPTHGLRSSCVVLDDEAIRHRAYEIWQKAGCPDGSHDEHWAQARSELEGEAAGAGSSAPTPHTPVSAEEVR
jgi:hypothetical protein